MKEKVKEVLTRQIIFIKPSVKEQEKTEKETKKFVEELGKRIKKKKIRAEVFVGGSLAKETLIKKDKYDIDIFVRFDRKYKDNEISEILGKLVRGKRVHGSRDYFQVFKKRILFEIVPTMKIKKPEEAENVTDLSYFHVNYIKNKIKKNKKLAEDIMLAKSFCYSQNCYGAEGYIKGFSGYALELLVSYYGSFLKFIKAIDKEKIVIDAKKFYKNEKEVMLELNEAKLQSPIVFVDPTFKERNALSALSVETFQKFKNACREFLKKPSERFFEKQDTEKNMKKKHKNLIVIEARTNKQKGDIAGSKLKKFYEFFVFKLGKSFEIKAREFEYEEKRNIGKMYFVLKQKKQILISGPPINKIENLMNFKKKHKNCFIKQGKAYAREKPKNLGKILGELKKDKVLKEMDVIKISVR